MAMTAEVQSVAVPEAEVIQKVFSEEPAEDVWEVVGGVDKGGIIVRTERDPTSPQAEERLSTGAMVRGLELDGVRLRYEKLSGNGPASGWVCVQLQGKPLLIKAQQAKTDSEPEEESQNSGAEEALRHYCERFGKAEQGTGQFNRQSFGWRIDAKLAPEMPSRHETFADLQADLGLKSGALLKDGAEVVAASRWAAPRAGDREFQPTFGYAGSLDRNASFARFDIRDEVCRRVGSFAHGDVVKDEAGNEFAVVGVKKAEGLLRLWFQPLNLDRRAAGAFLSGRLELVPNKVHKLEEAKPEDFEGAEDSDGEEVLLCAQCRLPAGQRGYVTKDKKEALLHGECMAQVMLQDLKAEEAARLAEEAALKAERRRQYNIGWAIERIPRNVSAAGKLRCALLPQGMVCLVFNQNSRSVRVAATLEPSAAVNLEYLSIALQVRRKEGREPIFSLDPVVKGDRKALNFRDEMQVKRFEPEWLNGTSVGEVMFQADYHLKELSMGEYEQPVVGMKSCHDFAMAEDDDKEWRAREWFVVRKAEVQQSEDGVLVPYVRMGVEAREQIWTDEGVEDAKLTRPDHPLVKYAEAFTNNFDLIAERKSVVYHLRELAKASVLAKFLLESGAHLEESWFDLAGEASPNSKLEIPQLWNMRTSAQIRLQNGTIIGGDAAPTTHGVYGGVQFGLDRFRTSAAKPIGRSFQPTLLSGSAPVTGRMAAPYYRPSRPGAPGYRPSALVSAPHALTAMQPAVHEPMGVDLSLDRFDLTDVTTMSAEKKLGSWAADKACVALGSAFWQGLEDSKTKAPFKEDDCKLLKAIYNPVMSDRRQEGDLFCPPDTSFAYVTKLRSLVKEEELVREARRNHFFSAAFSTSEPGPLFPYSWTTAFAIARGVAEVPSSPGGLLHARPDYKAEAAVFEAVLKSSTPEFDKSTEDGLRFRIYRFGSVQVRTTQEYDGQEVIGAVFSIRSPRSQRNGQASAISGEKFVKVTEYVEWSADEVAETAERRSFVLLETERGNVVVTEKLNSGAVKWTENPTDLEDRISLAKIVRTSDCSVAVRDMRRYQLREAQRADSASGTSEGKRYAQGAYSCADGGVHGICSGFSKPALGACRWRLHTV